MDEVRSGGSYISQRDLRLHFGLGKAESVEIEVRWLSGTVQKLAAKANQILKITEPAV